MLFLLEGETHIRSKQKPTGTFFACNKVGCIIMHLIFFGMQPKHTPKCYQSDIKIKRSVYKIYIITKIKNIYFGIYTNKDLRV